MSNNQQDSPAPGIAEEFAVAMHACSVGRADILSKAITQLRASSSADETAIALGNIRNDAGESPLHICSSRGFSDVLRVLLSNGLDPSLRVRRVKPYNVATPVAQKAFFTYLLERIAMTDIPQIEKLLMGDVPFLYDGDSLLNWTCSFGYLDVASTLIIYGANVNDADRTGMTPLHVACKNNFLELVRLLLNENADRTRVNNQGHLAADLTSSDEIKSLLADTFTPTLLYTHQATLKAAELQARDAGQDAQEDAAVKRALYESGFISSDEDEGDKDAEDSVEDPEEEPMPQLMLWPLPQRYSFSSSEPLVLTVAETLLICVASKTVDVFPLLSWSGFIDILSKLHIGVEVQRTSSAAKFRLAIDPLLCPGTHRYQLIITPLYVSLLASDTNGLMYGLLAFTQYLQLYGEVKDTDAASVIQLPCIDITDWPDTPHRAVLWSYKDSALSSSATLRSTIEMLAKLRINRFILLLNEESSAATTDEGTVSIYSLDELCRRHCVDLLPAVVLSNTHQRLSATLLQNFSNTVLFIFFLYDETCDAEACSKACRDNMLIAQSAGISSLHISTSPWMHQSNCNPLDIASSLGMRAIDQPLDSMCPFSLSMKALNGVDAVLDNFSRYSLDMLSKGRSCAILPGLLNSFFTTPLVLIKFYIFLHAGYSWNRLASADHFAHPGDISIMKDAVRMVLFPAQFYTRNNTSIAFHNTSIILDLLSSTVPSTDGVVIHPMKLQGTENTLWCMVNASSDLRNVKVPPKAFVAECLRNYKRCLASSKWRLGTGTKAPSTAVDPASDTLDSDEFFAVMHLVSTLCKLIVFGYNALEKMNSQESTNSPTLHTLVSAIPLGTKSDLANSFLITLESCMSIWRQRFEAIHFPLNEANSSNPAASLGSHDALLLARSSYLSMSNLCFPALKILCVLCQNIPIASSVDGVLQRIFNVAESLLE